MSKEERSINQNWRKRLDEIGQAAYEFEEMSRLGFLSNKKIAKIIEASGISLQEYEKAKSELSDISNLIRETNE